MTVSRQDYIKAIYELGGEKNKIGTKDIAKALDISPPSVSEMIKTLVREDYIEYELYKGVRLTNHGLDEAKRIKKRHLLWEVFLVEKLGYDWEDVHAEAEILEHVTSLKLEELLERYLDYPKTCPHGTPIGGNGYLFKHDLLDDIGLGNKVIVNRFKDEKETLRYVRAMGLNIGDLIRIISKEPKGVIKIQKNGQKDLQEIKKEFAKKIYVSEEIL